MRTAPVTARCALPVLLLPILAACGPLPTSGAQPTPQSQTVVTTPGGTAAATAPSAATSPSVAAPSPVGAPGDAGLHVVHSPGVVTDDEHLTPGQCHARTGSGGQPLPDRACTPGAIDPAVTQADIATTICRSGYTSTVRPPASDTGRWKIRTYVFYGLDTTTSGEYDHLVPLELGGANSTSNLWIEPGTIPNPKDKVENRLHDEVCAGRLTLASAQEAIATDWTTLP